MTVHGMERPNSQHETDHEDEQPAKSSTHVQINENLVSTDSMVTVRLSSPEIQPEDIPLPEDTAPLLEIDTNITLEAALSSEEDSPEIESTTPCTEFQDVDDINHTILADPVTIQEVAAVEEEGSIRDKSPKTVPRSRSNSGGTEIDWDELERNEEQEPRDEGSDESTAFLLARLEQENNALATNPKAGLSKSPSPAARPKGHSRPPSIQHLKKLVHETPPPSLRYSQLPAPPPMTELEFYTALVTDYKRTAQCLPTLLSKKVRGGIPPPLRGMVWQSMAGSRDLLLEDQYDRLAEESSPYEGMIGKDIGRSFPGVDMFKDSNGDGQRMLGRVLKAFSLYDHKIGYCQGLGFIVGPLLMHMGEKEAFCILVRLMEQYDLRSCFLPDLSGLHLRIFQFSRLLAQHLPALSTHFEKLQIEPAYVSQWFLSFFAVTCPLPMLFRIYDVIFAEGASETIMRVALSLMRRNEIKLLGFTEFEDVMQFLLSRSLWNTYSCNADDLVNDFVGLTGIVTRESLQALETSFKDSQPGDAASKVVPLPDLQAAASRFLGRIWAGSNSSTKSVTLSPGLSAPSRPASFLRRTPSKQSLASTLNSIEGKSESVASGVPTEATTMSRDSSADSASVKSASDSLTISTISVRKTAPSKDRDLHGQIEDLLTALSEMQKDQALLAGELQREREERDEDRRTVCSLLKVMKASEPSDTLDALEDDLKASEDVSDGETIVVPTEEKSKNLPALIKSVEDRFSSRRSRISAILETKQQLRNEIARVKEQYDLEQVRSRTLDRQLTEKEQELVNVKEDLREARARVQESNQRLEKERLDNHKSGKKATSPSESGDRVKKTSSRDSSANRNSAYGGLRELKLGRPDSMRSPQQSSTFAKRSSSLATQTILATDNHAPASPDTLLVELVNAKTAEAVAKQEAEEAKAKLEALRKMLGPATSSAGTAAAGHRPSPSQPNIERSATMSAFSSYINSNSSRTPDLPKAQPAQAPAITTSSGSFWSSWGKRNVSAAEAR